MKYSKEMENLKQMHHKQIKENREQQAMEEAKIKTEYKKNLQRNETVLKSQLTEKEKAYHNTLQEKELSSQDAYSKQSTKSQQMLLDQKERLARDFEKREGISADNQKNAIGKVSTEYESYRAQKESESKKSQQKQSYKLDETEDKYQRQLVNKDRDHSVMLEEMRELSRDGLAHEKRTMQKQLEKDRQSLEKAKEDLEVGRHGKQMEQLKIELADTKKDHDRDLRKTERAKKRELENVKISYQDNLEGLQKERSSQLVLHQNIRRDQAVNSQRQAEEKLKDSHDFFNDHLIEESDHHDAQVARLQRQYSKDSIQKQGMQDFRFRKIQDDYVKDRNNLQKQHERNVDGLRNEQQKVLYSERHSHVKERDDMNQRFQTQMDDMQKKHQTDLYEMQSRYDGMLTQLKDDYQNHITTMERQSQEKDLKNQQTQEQVVKQKEDHFEYRLKKIEEAYNENLKRVNGRHEENIKTLASNKTTKGRYA